MTPFRDTTSVFHETAASVFRQTLRQFEWVIVDDGTTDVTALDILETYRNVDPRVRVVRMEEPGGPGAARNRGFDLARAPYVMQLDSDDQLEPTAIEELYWFLETHPWLAFAKGYSVGFGAESYVWVNGFHLGAHFLESNGADVLAMVRVDVARAVRYDETNRDGLEDWEFWLACAAAGHWGATVHGPLGWVRRRGTHTDTWPNWDDGRREEAFRKRLRERYAPLWDAGFPEPEPRASSTFDLAPRHVNELAPRHPHLLLVVPWLEVGGADRINLRIVGDLVAAGWAVTVVTTVVSDHPWEGAFRMVTPDVLLLDRFIDVEDRPRFLDYLIRSRRPDVVLVSNSALGYDLLPYLRSRHPQPAYVDLTHAEEEQADGGHPASSCLQRSWLDLRITGSHHLARWMEARCGADERVVVWHAGIDTDRFVPLTPAERVARRHAMGLDATAVAVGFVGRLSPEKQPDVFVDSIDRVHDRSVMGVIVGDGPRASDVRRQIETAQDSSRFLLLGRLTDDDVPSTIGALDLVVLPSTREGVAVVIYEAMACGVAVIVTDVGGQRELVVDGTGLVLDDPAADDFTDRLAEAITDLVDEPERRIRMGRAARDHVVEHFSATLTTSQLVDLLDPVHSRWLVQRRPIAPDDTDLGQIVDRHRRIEDQHRYTRDLARTTETEVIPDRGPAYRTARWLYRRLVAVPGVGDRLGGIARRIGGGDA